jgi:hypothetical protein
MGRRERHDEDTSAVLVGLCGYDSARVEALATAGVLRERGG